MSYMSIPNALERIKHSDTRLVVTRTNSTDKVGVAFADTAYSAYLIESRHRSVVCVADKHSDMRAIDRAIREATRPLEAP